MSIMVMLGLACCLASSSHDARWLNVSRLQAPVACHVSAREARHQPAAGAARGAKQRASHGGRAW